MNKKNIFTIFVTIMFVISAIFAWYLTNTLKLKRIEINNLTFTLEEIIHNRNELKSEYEALQEEVRLEKEYRAEMEEQYNSLSNYHYLGECTLTAYCCEKYKHICGTGTGITASGLPVQPGVVAVDPSVIPLGSTVIIDGVSYIAADTGGEVKGNKIDIAFETHQEAVDFAMQKGNVWWVEND